MSTILLGSEDFYVGIPTVLVSDDWFFITPIYSMSKESNIFLIG